MTFDEFKANANKYLGKTIHFKDNYVEDDFRVYSVSVVCPKDKTFVFSAQLVSVRQNYSVDVELNRLEHCIG